MRRRPSTALAVALAAGPVMLSGCSGDGRPQRDIDPPAQVKAEAASITLTPPPRGVPVPTKYSRPSVLTGDETAIVVRTTDGDTVSRDGGRSWRDLPERLVSSGDFFAPFEARKGATFSQVVAGRRRPCTVIEIRRAAGPARRVAVPDCGEGRMTVTSDGHVLFVPYTAEGGGYQAPRYAYRTGVVGRRWSRSTMPKGLVNPNALAADGQLAIAVFGTQRDQLVVSSDAARTWKRRSTPIDCGAAAIRADNVWLTCGRRVYYSDDGGHEWRAHELPRIDLKDDPLSDEPFGTTTIVATGGQSAAIEGSGVSILTTTDGGARWTQRWPTRNRTSSRAIFG